MSTLHFSILAAVVSAVDLKASCELPQVILEKQQFEDVQMFTDFQ